MSICYTCLRGKDSGYAACVSCTDKANSPLTLEDYARRAIERRAAINYKAYKDVLYWPLERLAARGDDSAQRRYNAVMDALDAVREAYATDDDFALLNSFVPEFYKT